MRIFKTLCAVLLCLLIMVMLPVQTFAAGSIDPAQNASLTIIYEDNTTPLVGAQFDIYLIATLDKNGELTAANNFTQFNVDIYGKNDAAWRTLTSTLEGYILLNNITPTASGKTTTDGTLTFRNKTAGVYLVMGHRHSQGGFSYTTEPFLVQLPSLNEKTNQWDYDVEARPKHEATPEEDCTITIKVLKRWDDKEHEKERPKEIKVQLYCDGSLYETVTLNAKIRWSYTWTGLKKNHDWKLVEEPVEGYQSEITRIGNTFVVTNTYCPEKPTPSQPTKPANPKLPQTGQLWWPVPLLTAAGLFLIVLGLLRRKGTGYEE